MQKQNNAFAGNLTLTKIITAASLSPVAVLSAKYFLLFDLNEFPFLFYLPQLQLSTHSMGNSEIKFKIRSYK